MKKVLFVATVVKKHINVFHLPYLKMFKDNGWETSVCARNDFDEGEECIIPYCDRYYDLPFERFPLKPDNLKVYKRLKKLINEEKYDIIHCHTPTGGLLARAAAASTRKRYGTRVIYTAHGFHFYKGAPLKNWLLYFPVEWLCSFLTDTLITINQEDFAFAKKHIHAKNIQYIPGIGIDTEKFKGGTERDLRAGLGVCDDEIILLSVGELTVRKNHKEVINALLRLNDPKLKYFICGSGALESKYKEEIEKTPLKDRVFFMGFRNDIDRLCRAADIFVFPSLQEGLPASLMEAMAAGKAVICSRIRGNTDLIKDGEGGFLYSPGDSTQLAEKIRLLADNPGLREKMAEKNTENIREFDIEKVKKMMSEIYMTNGKSL